MHTTECNYLLIVLQHWVTVCEVVYWYLYFLVSIDDELRVLITNC